MPVRSEALVVTTLTTPGNVAVLTVAPEMTVIVKDLHLRNRGTVNDLVDVYAWRGVPGTDAMLFSEQLAAGAWKVASSWLVLEGGDQVYVRFTTGPIALWLSGANLP